jgi:hypothetical protein
MFHSVQVKINYKAVCYEKNVCSRHIPSGLRIKNKLPLQKCTNLDKNEEQIRIRFFLVTKCFCTIIEKNLRNTCPKYSMGVINFWGCSVILNLFYPITFDTLFNRLGVRGIPVGDEEVRSSRCCWSPFAHRCNL